MKKWLPFGAVIVVLIVSGIAIKSYFFSGIRAEPPDIKPDPSPPAVELSTINIPITVNLAALAQQAESTIPTEQNMSGAWAVVAHDPVGDVGEKHIIRRDPLHMSAQGNQLVVSTTAHYWLKVAQNVSEPWPLRGNFWNEIGSCGVGNNDTPEQTVAIKLTSLLKVDPNYHLASSSVGAVDMLNSCQVTRFNISLDGKIHDLFQVALNSTASKIDQQIPNLTNFRSQCATAWQTLQNPISLGNGIWLSLNPQSIQISQASGTGENLSITIGFAASPKVAIGEAPAAGTVPLPTQLNTAASQGQIHVALLTDIAFDEATKQINQRLAGRPYPIGPYKLEIVGADVYGSGSTTVLHLKTQGSLKADIYLTGQPKFDPINSVFSVEHLDFDLKTKNLLAKAADWLLHSKFCESLADATTVSLAGQVAAARKELEAAINRPLNPHVTLRGKVDALRCLGITSTPSLWRAVVSLDGAASADLH